MVSTGGSHPQRLADAASRSGRGMLVAVWRVVVCVCVCVLASVCLFFFFGVCVCVFIKLHITTQSGPVILVILCHSH